MPQLHIHQYSDPKETETVFTIQEGNKVLWLGPTIVNGNKLLGINGTAVDRRGLGADRFVQEIRRQVKFGCDHHKVEVDLSSAAWRSRPITLT